VVCLELPSHEVVAAAGSDVKQRPSGRRMQRTRVPRVARCSGSDQRGEGMDHSSLVATNSMER
jgi:hypothetical protein